MEISGNITRQIINKNIETERLILRAVKPIEQDIIANHLKSDGDFRNFSGEQPTTKNIKWFSHRASWCVYFVIERKSDQQLLGYIGVPHVMRNLLTVWLEFYIFKEQRQNGYAKEAITALTEKLFKRKLFRHDGAAIHPIIIKADGVRVWIPAYNKAAIKTVESCGFVHEGTEHKVWRIGKDRFDWELYYLTTSMVK